MCSGNATEEDEVKQEVGGCPLLQICGKVTARGKDAQECNAVNLFVQEKRRGTDHRRCPVQPVPMPKHQVGRIRISGASLRHRFDSDGRDGNGRVGLTASDSDLKCRACLLSRAKGALKPQLYVSRSHKPHFPPAINNSRPMCPKIAMSVS